MTMTDKHDFERALEFVLREEGGYSNNPADPGGKTMYGISQRKYPHLYEDGKLPTKSDAIAIYYTDYWQQFGCDKEEWPMNIILFDTYVNMHPNIVAKIRERATDWQDFLWKRLNAYLAIVRAKREMNRWLLVWVGRVYRLYNFIRNMERA